MQAPESTKSNMPESAESTVVDMTSAMQFTLSSSSAITDRHSTARSPHLQHLLHMPSNCLLLPLPFALPGLGG
eukprot:5800230-Heterocapsa_arctica.AAC.1